MITGDGPDEIILDSGPGIALDRLGYIDVLSREDDLLLSLPEPVAQELAAKPDRPGGRLPSCLPVRPVDAAEMFQIRRQTPQPILGLGELGVVLATERQWSTRMFNPACAVIDDRDAWEFARARWGGVDRLSGTLSLLYLVHERHLEQRSLRADVELLLHSGHRLSQARAARFVQYAEPLLERVRAVGSRLPTGEAWLRRLREGGMERQPRPRPAEPGRDRTPTIE